MACTTSCASACSGVTGGVGLRLAFRTGGSDKARMLTATPRTIALAFGTAESRGRPAQRYCADLSKSEMHERRR